MHNEIGEHLRRSAQRVIADLRELATLTSTPDGAQRVAWGPVWKKARGWLLDKVSPLRTRAGAGCGGKQLDHAARRIRREPSSSAGIWTRFRTAAGSMARSVCWSGWKRFADTHNRSRPSRFDWSIGPTKKARASGAAFSARRPPRAGSNVDEIRELRDADGIRLEDALRDHGVMLDTMLNARQELARIDAKAYLEMHIEQGPVLESMNRSAGVVLGTFGLERNMVRFVGQAAHSGSTPIAMRRDAFLAAAATALECREIARRHSRPGAGVVCTVGVVKVEPGIVTAVPGVAEISIDQRALDPEVLAVMYREAQDASRRFARGERRVGRMETVVSNRAASIRSASAASL